MDVVHSVAGEEAEDLVRDARLRAPPLAEGVDPGHWIGRRALDEVGQLVGQVIVRPRRGMRHRAEHGPLDQVAANEVQRGATRLRCQLSDPVRQARQQAEQRVGEVLVGRVQQL